MTDFMADWPTCETCGEKYGGSHWHCSCGSTDTTSMYGHHTSWCRVFGKGQPFHHCGPGPDGCELRADRPHL